MSSAANKRVTPSIMLESPAAREALLLLVVSRARIASEFSSKSERSVPEKLEGLYHSRHCI
jgi:hypothetical protein